MRCVDKRYKSFHNKCSFYVWVRWHSNLWF
nr:MAG TPA: hypothetical protein [Caudoviricetes sp.]